MQLRMYVVCKYVVSKYIYCTYTAQATIMVSGAAKGMNTYVNTQQGTEW